MDSEFVLPIKEHWGKMLMMCAALYLDGPSDAPGEEGGVYSAGTRSFCALNWTAHFLSLLKRF